MVTNSNDVESPMNSDERRGAIGTGLLLTALGVVFLLAELGVASMGDLFRDWWPLFVIGFGIVCRAWFVIAIGVWLLISELRLFGLSFSSSWPIVLMVIGIGLIAQSLLGRSRSEGGRKS